MWLDPRICDVQVWSYSLVRFYHFHLYLLIQITILSHWEVASPASLVGSWLPPLQNSDHFFPAPNLILASLTTKAKSSSWPVTPYVM